MINDNEDKFIQKKLESSRVGDGAEFEMDKELERKRKREEKI